VTLTDLRLAREQNNVAKLEELTAIRTERFQLMEDWQSCQKNMVFFTQITMEAGEDGEFLDAMREANIKGALVGVEAVTPEDSKLSLKISTALARPLRNGYRISSSTAFTSLARSSSDSRPISRQRSMRPSRWRCGQA